MAVLDHTHSAPSNWFARVGVALLRAIDKSIEARSRSAELAFYEGLSDAELAAKGLRREDIVRHVFRDTFW